MVRVLVEMIDPRRVEGPRAADDAVHLVAVGQQQLGEIAAVLARDPVMSAFFTALLCHKLRCMASTMGGGWLLDTIGVQPNLVRKLFPFG